MITVITVSQRVGTITVLLTVVCCRSRCEESQCLVIALEFLYISDALINSFSTEFFVWRDFIIEIASAPPQSTDNYHSYEVDSLPRTRSRVQTARNNLLVVFHCFAHHWHTSQCSTEKCSQTSLSYQANRGSHQAWSVSFLALTNAMWRLL